MSALYPDVPEAPGVPDVLRLVGVVPSDPVAAFGGMSQVETSDVQWGIFDNDGAPLLSFDSFVSFDYQSEAAISDFPIEQGSFQSYNKVNRPFASRVRVAQSGTSEDKIAFLQGIEALRQSTDTCIIVTPDFSYENANVTRYDYARQSDAGAQMIVAELHLEEIRQNDAQTNYMNTRSPASADAVNDGKVQTMLATDPYSDPI